MPIPDYQTLMLPLLKLINKVGEIPLKEAAKLLADELGLTEEEKNKLLPSGTQTFIHNRVGWAGSYLKQAGLLYYPKRGLTSITEEGKALLKENPERIDNQFLKRYDKFVEFYNRKRSTKRIEKVAEDDDKDMTPEEALEYGYERINESLASDLLTIIKDKDPAFFERLVVELLVKMGYGGSRQEAGEVLGKSGDEGIDGIIKEDKLGLDIIYIQAKRWEGVVGRPEIQKFAGALSGKGAHKGIFITTSRFTREAIEYAENSQLYKIVLIDGDRLAELMIENNLGVSTTNVYEVKKIDSDYFEE